MRRLTDTLIAALIPGLILVHLYLAPYTKVEESFNIQATHDVLKFGIPWKYSDWDLVKNYDHVTFPGSVPRTFVGPLALAGATWPLLRFFDNADKQLMIRGVLGLFNAFCLLYFRNGVAKTFGRVAANWFVLFQASQFHVMYYASRTLPNFFAFGLGLLALRDLMPHFHLRHVVVNRKKRQTVSVHPPNAHSLESILLYRRAIVVLTAIGVIFRSELALLLGSHALYLLIQRRISLDPLQDILPSGLLGVVIGILVSVPVDSYFWQHFPTWSELSGFMFNIMEGKSTDWGISPFHFYFTSSLPRLLFNPLVYFLCIPLAVSMGPVRKPSRDIVLPNLFFVFLYSFQPHKEWRFIVYVVPPIFAAAAAGASWIWLHRAKSFVCRFLSLCLIASTLGSFGASFAMLAISRLNYPGADALNRLHAIADGDKRTINVHMDTLTCMNGVTHFLENPPPKGIYNATVWRYDKTEDTDRLLDPIFWAQFDYVLAESPERVIGKWEVVETVDAYAGLDLLRPGQSVEVSETEDENSVDAPLIRLVKSHSVQEVRGLVQEGLVVSKEVGQGIISGVQKEGLWGAVKTSVNRFRRLNSEEQRVLANNWSYKFARRYLTGGWWIKPRMEPKIRILRQQLSAV